jgi:hypothetical protein
LERVQDGSAVDAVLPGKIVHAPASLVLIAELCYFVRGEAPLVPSLARYAIRKLDPGCLVYNYLSVDVEGLGRPL